MTKCYHLSKKFLGAQLTLKPKIPESSVISEEGDIPRVCFSENPFLCVRSICGSGDIKVADLSEFKDRTIKEPKETWKDFINEKEKTDYILINPSIYVTEEILYLPPSCSDFRANKERWSLNKINVEFIGYLCLKSLLDRKLVNTDQTKSLDTETFQKSKDKRLFIPRNKLR